MIRSVFFAIVASLVLTAGWEAQAQPALPMQTVTRDVGFRGLFLFEDYHAKERCPRLCQREGMRWSGRWQRESCNCEKPAAASRWVFCARENGRCRLPFPTAVTYGANGAFTTRNFRPGLLTCSNAVFGDPLVGVAKSCFYLAR